MPQPGDIVVARLTGNRAIVRWRVAAQNGLAATMVALLLQAAPARADGAPNLILPLVTAIAFASAASNVPRQVATLDPGRRPLLSLLPKQVQIVDGYQYDFEDYVGLKRPSDMVDSDRIVSYDILRQPAAAGRPSSPTTKSTAAPSPAAATSSASNSSTASERRARHLSAVEGHHLLSAIAELREAFGACCSPSLPTPSPCPSSCYQRTGLFPPFAGYRRRGSVPRLGTTLPGRRLDEAGRYEVRIEFGDLVHVVFGPKPLGDVVGAWSG